MDVPNEDGCTPLIYAKARDNTTALKMLIEHGAQSVPDMYGSLETKVYRAKNEEDAKQILATTKHEGLIIVGNDPQVIVDYVHNGILIFKGCNVAKMSLRGGKFVTTKVSCFPKIISKTSICNNVRKKCIHPRMSGIGARDLCIENMCHS